MRKGPESETPLLAGAEGDAKIEDPTHELEGQIFTRHGRMYQITRILPLNGERPIEVLTMDPWGMIVYYTELDDADGAKSESFFGIPEGITKPGEVRAYLMGCDYRFTNANQGIE